jgi:hypothetical protein
MLCEACLSIASARGPQGPWHANAPKRWAAQKTSITIFYDVQDPFSFSAPPFTAPRKHARVSSVLPVNTAARERFRFARACMIRDSPALF